MMIPVLLSGPGIQAWSKLSLAGPATTPKFDHVTPLLDVRGLAMRPPGFWIATTGFRSPLHLSVQYTHAASPLKKKRPLLYLTKAVP